MVMPRKYPPPQIGDEYNEWIVISTPSTGKLWCLCSCGEVCLTRGYDVTSGKSKRCRKCGDSQPKLSMRRTHLPHIPNRLYNRLRLRAFNAINRCANSNHPRYHDWGGRGIKVLFESVEQFVEYLITLPGHDDPKLFL